MELCSASLRALDAEVFLADLRSMRTVAMFLALAFSALPEVCRAGFNPDEFRAYWNKGKGEITGYKLTQSRYGELHEGDAVLLFVTEPFSRSKQVKLDDWEHAGSDSVNVLKLNFSKKFLTGIYPYSLMLSTFTPIDSAESPRTLKTSMTGQEWCGHVFTQLNLHDDQYDCAGFSYFASEGDTRQQLPAVFLEDEVWSRIRLNPEKL